MNLTVRLLIATFFLFFTAAVSLQPGDVLLQSQPCFMCSLMEIEEGLPYSHAGVLIRNADGSFSVLEAWNRVARTSLASFLARRRSGTETLILRPHFYPGAPRLLPDLNRWLLARYGLGFSGHTYDPDFLWDNQDGAGEKYYCSELVAKLLNPLLAQPLRTKPMHYQKYREYWIRYFRGTPPDGKPGISPADLVRSGSFSRMGNL